MPDVVGMNAAKADQVLQAAGLTNVTFVDADGDPIQVLTSWTVTKQSVKPGTEIDPGSPVTIICKPVDTGRG
jgi:beta-lactam-binding protein with PASTA domain